MSIAFRIVEFIRLFTEQHGYAPMNSEIAAGVGVHETTVTRYIRRLTRMGYVTRVKYKQRSVAVVKIGDAA